MVVIVVVIVVFVGATDAKVKVKPIPTFPSGVKTGTNTRLDLGQRIEKITNIFTRDLAVDERGRLVNTSSKKPVTFSLVEPLSRDKCMTFDVPG